MALAKTLSVTLNGVAAQLVEVEANIGAGLPGTHIVGLASAAVNQARDRIKIAAQNSKLPWPKTKIMVSLLPSDVPKTGSHFDAAIAVAILSATHPDARVRASLAPTPWFLAKSDSTVASGPCPASCPPSWRPAPPG